MNPIQNQHHLSSQEMTSRMENMAKLAFVPQHAFKILRLKADVQQQNRKQNDAKTKANLNFAMGLRKGLHQEQSVKEVEQVYEHSSKSFALNTYHEAKTIYTNHCDTLTKKFHKAQKRETLKIEFNYRRDNFIAERTEFSSQFSLDKEIERLKQNRTKNKVKDREI
jgi:hypothetical protein